MEQVDQLPVEHRSWWRKLINFPLVTLLLAVLIYIVAMAAALPATVRGPVECRHGSFVIAVWRIFSRPASLSPRRSN